MKLLIDLQGCQATGSRNRGIGRYSLALARALAASARKHEIWVLLNAAFPETIEVIRRELEGLVPPGRIAAFHPPPECAEIAREDRWRTLAAEAIRAHAVRELQPDVVHVSSLFEGLVDDSVTSIDPEAHGIPTAVTLYDLIPLLNAERYLPDDRTNAWYRRKIESLCRADLMLGISQSACDEALSALASRRGRVLNISTAADPGRFHPGDPGDAAGRHGLRRDFIMYTGGIDWRKNIEGLVRAYAALPRPLRLKHQLALVCHAETHARTQILSTAARLGLAPGDVVFTGYVSDQDLADLYRACTLFVFPSLHEGFGLPALEAMMCGAVVIGSDATSIPEVIGRQDALFDPRSEESMTRTILRAIEDEPFRQALREHAPIQSARFTWELTAQRAWDALEELHALHAGSSHAPRARKPRLAMHSPLPPAQSGIADYTAELLEALADHYEVELVTDQPEVKLPSLVPAMPVRTPAWFRENAARYDRIVYQFGNSVFHAHMFDLLREHPGVVVLHDFFLSGVLNWMDTIGTDPGVFPRSLLASHGAESLEFERAQGRDAALLRYPANRLVVERATGVIVHSDHARREAARWYGEGSARDWQVIPLVRHAPAEVDRQRARAELGIAQHEFLVCSFGHVAPTKLNVETVRAWNASSLATDAHCRLVLVGGARPPYSDGVRDAIRSGPLPGNVSITGFAERELYERYLAAADLAVQLRTMSRGETSAAVLDCMGFGVPVIANANGSTTDYAAGLLHLLPDEFEVAELVAAMETLRADPAGRARLSAAGRAIVQGQHDPRAVALRYRDAIEEFAHRPRNVNYWKTVECIAALGARPAEDDLIEAAVALSATVAAVSRTGRGTPAPSGAP